MIVFCTVQNLFREPLFYAEFYTVQAKKWHDHNMAIVKTQTEKFSDSELIYNVNIIRVKIINSFSKELSF